MLHYEETTEEAMIELLGSMFAFAMLLGGVALMAGCSSAAADTAVETPVVLVRTAAVEHRHAAEPVHATGLVAAKDELPLSFKVGGVVRSVLVGAGASVKAGQLLATIDTAEVDAQLSQARDQLLKAERDLVRITTLHEEHALPLQAKQDAETNRDVARAGLHAVEFNRRYASIVAPADGRIMRRHHDPDELVQVGTPIFDFASSARGYVIRVGVTDRDVVRIAVGDLAGARLAAYQDQVVDATVSEISGAASESTGTFDVELRVAAGSPRLLSGMSAAVTIEPGAKRALAFVPVEAFLEGDGDRGCVYALSGDGSAHRIPVRVGFIDDSHIAIASGLDGVERVVTDGAAYLRDGAAVRIASDRSTQ